MKTRSRWTSCALLLAGLAWASPAAAQEYQPPNEMTEETASALGVSEKEVKPQTLRPEIWDETPEAAGVLTTERALLPPSLTLSRGKRSERPQVDREDLTQRRKAMITGGERFTDHISHQPDAAVSEDSAGQKAATEHENGSSAISFWISLVFAAGALGVYFKTRGGAS